MSPKEIIELILLILSILTAIVSIIYSIVKGNMKNFIIEKMEEAEEIYKDVEDTAKRIELRLCYVINAVKEKYKLVSLILNIKEFIEKVISISKKINYKK